VCLIFFTARSFVDLGGARGAIFLLRARGAGASVVFLLQAVHLVQGYFFPTAEKLTKLDMIFDGRS
jgi:hypothetical protein